MNMRALCTVLALPLLAQTPQQPPQQTPPPAKQETAAKPAPLSFFSQKFPYAWDQLLPLKAETDGVRLNSIFFNRKALAKGPLKGVEFGTRAQVEVTNTTQKARTVGFAVAVFDRDARLIGVASGGTRWFSLRPGATSTFDLGFSQVLERLPLGDHFVLSMELGE